MKATYPLISCICMSTGHSSYLKEAIDDFESQNYLNKELIISYSKKDLNTKSLVQQYALSNAEIKGLQQEHQENDEATMRKAIHRSSGTYICFWNGKDRHHSSRLSYQYHSMESSMQGHQASMLTRIVLYDQRSKQAYLSATSNWDSTLLIKKKLLASDELSSFGEESAIVPDYIYTKKLVLFIEKAPFLYVKRPDKGNEKTSLQPEDLYGKSEFLSPEYKQLVTELL